MKSFVYCRKPLSWLLAATMSVSLTAPALAAPAHADPTQSGPIQAGSAQLDNGAQAGQDSAPPSYSPSPDASPSPGVSQAPQEPSIPGESAAPDAPGTADPPQASPAPDASAAPEESAPQPSNTPELTGPNGITYEDVPNDAWYAPAVYYCLNAGLMFGVSEGLPIFAPESRMTRATLATVLYRIQEEPRVTGENVFQDVKAGMWYTDAVLWASGEKIMQGYGNGLFGVDDPVTREEMTTILWRFAGSPTPKGTGAGYADQADVSSWAATGTAWCQEQDIIYTEPAEYLVPQAQARRCEIAWALMKFDTRVVEPQPQPEPEPEPEPEYDPWADFEARFGYLPEKGKVSPNPYTSSNFQVQPNAVGASYMSYQGGAYTIGVDISSWQKTVDWQAVAGSGVQFAMLRVGFRGYGSGAINRDSYFTKNIEGALAAGLQVGVYFFSQAVTIDEAVKEAEYTLKMIKNYNVTCPVVFDWERQSADTSRTKDTSNETIVACALAFCKTVEAAGYIPMFYASPSKAYKLELGYLSDYPFWLAHYTAYQAPTSYKYHFDIWQYSSKWQVPGVDGDCDVNIGLTNWDAWRAERQAAVAGG